jgi:acyl-coenzyme A thioesterase PaaI-like protein
MENCAVKKIDQFKATAFLRLFSFVKIPLLGWIRPTVMEMDEQRTVLKIPLNRRTKNHLGVMYFGAIAMGAEAAVAIRAVQEIQKSGQRVDFLFKDFTANFIKRCEGDVHFVCEQGSEVRDVISKTIQTGQRETKTFRSYAIVPSQDPKEIVAEFTVTLSAKARLVKKDEALQS